MKKLYLPGVGAAECKGQSGHRSHWLHNYNQGIVVLQLLELGGAKVSERHWCDFSFWVIQS